ncbi:hypothetical protein DPMN_051621 [Dreissena polymorpha]|uniref:Uncharacterized protein n=1 Tax=Dreissena polymorpha TaxID=45954 RepID=A0A9D4HMA8_DREPO|nr:hypothetical protein DPMN_051621 [Dreissena polymorpha]
MARQRPKHIPTPHIDRIVIRVVQYQLEVNRCRNEEVIVKVNFGWVRPMWAGRPRVGNGAMHKVQYKFENRCRNEEIIVKGNLGWVWSMWAGGPRINRIVIRVVQYQFEVNRLKGNFGWVWSMWAGRPKIDRIVIREVQYQFKVNRSRNEEVNGVGVTQLLTKFGEDRFQGSSANSVGGDSGQDGQTAEITTISPRFSKSGAPGLVIGPCIVEIDRIYQLEVNRWRNEEVIVKGNFEWVWSMWAGRPRIGNGAIHKLNWCRNEEIIVKGNFGWVWPMLAGRPRIDRIVIREVQYQFEVNRCNFWWVWSMWALHPRIDRIVIREVQYQFEVNPCRSKEEIVARTDGRRR